MSGFDQSVSIKVKLDSDGIVKSLGKVSGAIGVIEDKSEALSTELGRIEDDIATFGDKLKEADDLEIGAVVDDTDVREAVAAAKGIADEEIASLDKPEILVGAKADVDETALKEQINEQADMLDDLDERLEAAIESKEKFVKANGKVEDAALASVTGIDEEKRGFSDLIEEGDSLTKIKQKVAGANRHLDKMNRETAESLDEETDGASDLLKSLGVVKKSTDDTTDSLSATTRQLRKMRNSTKKSTRSMRAAAEVGDLFEDGLGALSVNLGAFTVALRNFLTQVPLLLTTLGAAGASALGAASGFLALAGAIGAVVGTGALAQAQQLKREFSGIEELGQGMQVIMLNLRDVLFQALEPLTESQATIDLFKKSVTGIARGVNVVAKAIAGLTEGTEEFNKRVEAGAEPAYTVQEAFEDFSDSVGPAFSNLVGSMTNAFELLGEEIVASTTMITNGLAEIINFSAVLFNRIEDIGDMVTELGGSFRELAILGTRIGGGLIPVFEAFSSVMETVAGALNDVDGETMQSAITFLAMIAAINRLAGVMSSIVIIFPNAITGMARISAEARATSGAFQIMRTSISMAGTQLASFLSQTSMLSGLTALFVALTDSEDRIRGVAFNSKLAGEAFDDMAQGTDRVADELRQLAVQGMFTNSVLKELGDDVDYDITPDRQLDPEQFLPDDPISKGLIGGLSEALDDTDQLFNTQNKGATFVVPGIKGQTKGSDSPFKMLADDDKALTAVKKKLEPLRKSLGNVKKGAERAVGGFRNLFVELLKVQYKAALTAATISTKLIGALVLKAQASVRAAITSVQNAIAMDMEAGAVTRAAIATNQYIGALLRSTAAKLKNAGRTALLTALTFARTLSIKTAIAALKNMIAAEGASTIAKIKGAAASAAAAAANYLLGIAALFAKTQLMGLASTLLFAAAVVAALVAVIGGLAVGLITNFDEIKAAANDAFGFLKQMIDIIVDVLITYFIATWNLIVDLLNAVVQGIAPLTDMIGDLASVVAGLGGEGEQSAGAMGMLATAADIVKGVINGLGTVLGALINMLGGILAVASTVIRFALTPLVVAVHILVAAVGLLMDFWDYLLEDLIGVEGGISGLIDIFIDLFETIIKGFEAIPGVVEDVVNFAIEALNAFLSIFEFVGLNINEVDTVDFTRDDLKADREELSSDGLDIGEMFASGSDDPEDQAQLSRVVTDAIAEANSFERRRHGGQ